MLRSSRFRTLRNRAGWCEKNLWTVRKMPRRSTSSTGWCRTARFLLRQFIFNHGSLIIFALFWGARHKQRSTVRRTIFFGAAFARLIEPREKSKQSKRLALGVSSCTFVFRLTPGRGFVIKVSIFLTLTAEKNIAKSFRAITECVSASGDWPKSLWNLRWRFFFWCTW